MFKQELKKWENKLRLYLTLHHNDVQLMNCQVCPFGGYNSTNHITHNREGCPNPYLSLTEDDRMLFTTKGNPSLRRISYCVEWIKYV